MKIKYTPAARDDLREIKSYISQNLKSPVAAKNVTERIIRSIHKLAEFPNLGLSIQEKTGRETDCRCLISDNYGIIYSVQNDIQIIRVLDLRTDYMRFIFQ